MCAVSGRRVSSQSATARGGMRFVAATVSAARTTLEGVVCPVVAGPSSGVYRAVGFPAGVCRGVDVRDMMHNHTALCIKAQPVMH